MKGPRDSKQGHLLLPCHCCQQHPLHAGQPALSNAQAAVDMQLELQDAAHTQAGADTHGTGPLQMGPRHVVTSNNSLLPSSGTL